MWLKSGSLNGRFPEPVLWIVQLSCLEVLLLIWICSDDLHFNKLKRFQMTCFEIFILGIIAKLENFSKASKTSFHKNPCTPCLEWPFSTLGQSKHSSHLLMLSMIIVHWIWIFMATMPVPYLRPMHSHFLEPLALLFCILGSLCSLIATFHLLLDSHLLTPTVVGLRQ